MKFDIITTITWLALSFDTTAAKDSTFKLGPKRFLKRSSKSSKSRNKPIIEKCSQVLYFDPAERTGRIQFYSAGPPALGNQLCGPSSSNPDLQLCPGDRGLVSPTILFSDDSLTKRIGFFTLVFTLVDGTGNDVTVGTIVFDEGLNSGSEIVFSGFFPLISYAITGGVGDFVGVSGNLDFSQADDKSLGDITINCL